MGLAIEAIKKKESGRENESGYLCRRCLDSITKYTVKKKTAKGC